MRTLIAACLALALGACASPPRKTVFIDQATHTASPEVRQVRTTRSMLRVTIVQNPAGPWVGSLKAELIEGDIYLSAIKITSMVQQTEFAVDSRWGNFPSDWRDRLYWIERDVLTRSPEPAGGRIREIHRSKIVLPTGS